MMSPTDEVPFSILMLVMQNYNAANGIFVLVNNMHKCNSEYTVMINLGSVVSKL